MKILRNIKRDKEKRGKWKKENKRNQNKKIVWKIKNKRQNEKTENGIITKNRTIGNRDMREISSFRIHIYSSNIMK